MDQDKFVNSFTKLFDKYDLETDYCKEFAIIIYELTSSKCNVFEALANFLEIIYKYVRNEFDYTSEYNELVITIEERCDEILHDLFILAIGDTKPLKDFDKYNYLLYLYNISCWHDKTSDDNRKAFFKHSIKSESNILSVRDQMTDIFLRIFSTS